MRVLDEVVIQGGRIQHIGAYPELDSFSGTVLQASGAPEGEITSIWVNKAPEGSRLPLPAAVKADGNTFEIGVRARFTGTVSTIVGIEVTVKDPDGKQRAAPTIDWTGMDYGEELEWEYNICRVDKPGAWTTVIRFVTQE